MSIEQRLMRLVKSLLVLPPVEQFDGGTEKDTKPEIEKLLAWTLAAGSGFLFLYEAVSIIRGLL